MELTPVFNAAAQGDDGQMPTDAGPDITDPGGGSASVAVERPAGQAAETSPSPSNSASEEFEYARDAPTHTSIIYRDDQKTNTAAMIEMLERGRARPSLKFNLRPRRTLEKAVHKEVEFDREKLLAAFRDELAWVPDIDDLGNELDDDLAPML